MQAIILAAGMGSRLKELTAENTKCMIQVNGVSLIERMLAQLDELGLSRIVLVIGYEGAKLVEFIKTLGVRTPVEFVENEVYAKTNNIYSLYLARKYLEEEDTLLLESDLIFESQVLRFLLDAPFPSLALVDKFESWMDGTTVMLDEDDSIVRFCSKRDFVFEDIPNYYKTVNIYKFSREFSRNRYVPFLEAYCKAFGEQAYYEQVLSVLVHLRTDQIKALRLPKAMRWYEIDDVQDLDIAESMFAPSGERMGRVSRRYGGYWRYPELIDFCYLVNPGFPNRGMISELKANFEALLCNYPSGQQVNALLAGKYFDLPPEWIVVGNGASESIKALMEELPGKKGVILPTFEEYPQRCAGEDLVYFTASGRDFSYTAAELIAFFSENPVDTLIVINPDNPGGNFIPPDGIRQLAEWAKERGMWLVVDESFLDFAEDNTPAMRRDFLADNAHVLIVKSISKSFGVPGIRLGLVSSSSVELMQRVRRRMVIWNINSYGEFFLQIIEKYKEEYRHSLELLRGLRADLFNELGKIPGIRPIPSQANYITFEITAAVDVDQLAEELLCKYDLLIKVLNQKQGINGNYVRVAVKCEQQNRQLVEALRAVLA